MSGSSSSSEVDVESGEGSTGKRGLPKSRGDRVSRSSSDPSGCGNDLDEGKGSGEGSASSSVIVALPPSGSGKDSSLQEVVLTGSEALDVLDQVSRNWHDVGWYVLGDLVGHVMCFTSNAPTPH